MSNPAKFDERIVEQWLKSQNYIGITRPSKDPPDYIIEENIAIEVRRLTKIVSFNGKALSEENQRIPLYRSIERALRKVELPEDNRAWAVSWEFDFTKTWPNPRRIQQEIQEILTPLIQQHKTPEAFNALQTDHFDMEEHFHELDHLTYPHICLPCGICLGIREYNAINDSGFYLQEFPEAEGSVPVVELMQSLQAAIDEKSINIEKRRRLEEFAEWWLIFTDHICLVPITILSDAEIEAVQNSVTNRHFWSRILLVGRTGQDWWFEF